MSAKMKNTKLKKIKARLQKNGVRITEASSPYIVIANGGLGNGISIAQISNLLDKFGKVLAISSNIHKSYCGAHLDSENAALLAVSNIQGTVLHKELEDNKPCILHAFFVETFVYFEEDNEMISSHDEFPSGLIMLHDFITKQEEQTLLQIIEEQESTVPSTVVYEKLKNRTVLHYGYRFQYGSNDVDLTSPLSDAGLPSFAKKLIQKLMATGYLTFEPNQLTINKYEPGDGIPAHIDNPSAFDEIISTISLGSVTVLEMTHSMDTRQILVQPRSLIIFSGAARYHWTHGIRQKRSDVIYFKDSIPNVQPRGTRVSLTFRRALSFALSDKFGTDDNESNSLSLPKNTVEADLVEKHYVHAVYNQIADHFATTREKPWPKVVEFLSSLEPFSFVLDVGCGSGRYLNACSNTVMFGCDYSTSLSDICITKSSRLFICDGMDIPIRSACFDACICIAVLHHFSTDKRRRNGVQELLRVTRSGGLVLIYVWAVEQKLNNVPSHYIKGASQQKHSSGKESKSVECTKNIDSSRCESECSQSVRNNIIVHKNRTEFEQQDVLVPWKMKTHQKERTNATEQNKQGSVFYRFYHVFKQQELEHLCCSLPECTIVKSYYDSGNWAIVLQKK